MKKILAVLIAIGITIGLYNTSFAVDVIVDAASYSGADHTDGLIMTFGAGTYDIKVVDGAWSTWDLTDFDTQAVTNLDYEAWLWSLVIYNGYDDFMLGDHSLSGVFYPTLPLTPASEAIAQNNALNNSLGQIKTLYTDSDFSFYIYDPYNRGAEGSVTVSVTLVPEPISTTLFIIGGVVLGGRSYIKRKKAKARI